MKIETVPITSSQGLLDDAAGRRASILDGFIAND